MIEAQFHCATCNTVAATLQLTDDNQFIQSGFMGNSCEGVSGRLAILLARALRQQNIGNIYKLNGLWAPFYCPTCQATYCNQHWLKEVQFDDDFAGWYDCTYGTCPAGHRRIVDD